MKDILINENYDVSIENGDFKVGNSENQQVEMILFSKQGEWKTSPELGCDIERAKNGSISRFLDRKIRVQLDSDGFEVEKLNITTEGIQLNGKYR